ncbi:hypothetical protein ACFLR7_05810 [Acidobacteriota bacterium]
MDEAVVCSFCSSHCVLQQRPATAKTLRVDHPCDEPREVEIMFYACRACGRTFYDLSAI